MSDSSADEQAPQSSSKLSRRWFLRGAGGVAAGSAFAGGLAQQAEAARARSLAAAPEVLEGDIEFELSINGQRMKLRCEPRTTLLNALRNHCEPPLTGTKQVCDRGNCGACTVHVDGRPANACLMLAVDLRGREVRTIEGLGAPGALNPLQESFWKHDAQMCGFCTPGFVMSIQACLEKKPNASLAEIKQGCAGNVCRCGTYPAVFEAALAVAKGEAR
ncbi:MAG: (2Fe-2S)-binding protein [Planctomycetia bacterium]